MTSPNDGSTPLFPFDEREDWPLYEMVGGMLLNALTRRFNLAQEDAESLLFEIFATYSGLSTKPSQPVFWFIVATCQHAHDHLRRRGLPVPPDSETVQAALLQRAAVDSLPELARKALRLKFHENLTFEQIGRELHISRHAAKRLVVRAIAALKATQKP